MHKKYKYKLEGRDVNMEVTVKLKDNLSSEDMKKECRKQVALELFKTREYSTGYCADLAGMSYDDFMHFVSSHKISLFERTEQEILDEFKNA